MKKVLLMILLAPALSWAGLFTSGGSNDYSNNAGNTFLCASSGTLQTQAGVSVTSPTLALYNPTTSGKNLVVLDVGINVAVSPAAAASFSLAYSTVPNAGVTNLDIGSQSILANTTPAYVGKSTASTVTPMKAVCTNFGLISGTPVIFRTLGGTTGASAISGVQLIDQTNGKVVVPPGGLISIQSTTAASIQPHFTWREDNL